ncbi:MAG TPA: hypothetical protein VKD72_12550 [Gemmataceae bacterium]|nr:hypothetical protein [Gemmataceae bacterium]
MSRQFFAVVAVALWLCGPGCRSAHLKMDQDCMRAALLDLYTNQIMDNLIRASNGYPIVQLDYSDITGTVTQNANASYGGNQTLQTARNELGVTTLRQFTNFFEYSIGGSQENQLTITANPVLNNNEVYNAYLEFLEKPERFIASDEPPPPGAAHIVRCAPAAPCESGCEPCKGKSCVKKMYFWVPCEYRYDFLRLALVTTVQRGQPLEVPDFFEVAVEKAEDTTPENLKKKKQTRFTLHFNKRIPNDSGELRVTVDDATHRFRLDRYTDPVDGAVVKKGDKIDRLWLLLTPDDPSGLTADQLKAALDGKKVRVDLDSYRPTLPTTEDLLKSIRRNVGLIRLQQFSR